MIKRLLLTSLAALALAFGSIAANAQAIRVVVDGDPIHFAGIGPREVNGRVLVPLRGVLEELGAFVEYDVATRTVMATKGEMNLELPLGQRYATIDGEQVELDVPATTIAGTTMVPLRFVSEALGARVRWNPRTATVAINTGAGVAEVVEPRNRAFRRPRTAVMPVVRSVSHNVGDGWIDPGDFVRVTMRATPGGTGYFRIRGMVGEVKMQEIEPGVYEGRWRADNATARELNEADILAFVVVGDRATAEMHP